jgi:glycosyltransferase involved in cell wall biosynthesis
MTSTITPAPASARRLLDTRVPILIYVDSSAEIGGLEAYTTRLATRLVDRGYRVGAICYRAEAIAPLRDDLARAGVTLHVSEDLDSSPLGRLKRLWSLRAAARQYRGGVLVLMMGYHEKGGMATFAGVLGGAGAIVRADLSPAMPPVPLKERLRLKLKDFFTHRIVVGAAENRESFAGLGRDRRKIAVVPTGIELDRFEPGRGRDQVRKELGYPDEKLVVGTIARLSEVRKGIDYFLQAAAAVAPGFPDAEFVIVGEGWMRPQFEAQARDLGIAERVRFTGWRSDIPEVLAALDVFVMPSLHEGGPTTVLEAMAMAKPTVATNVGMVPEVIDDGRTGLIVPTADSGAIARALAGLLGDADLRKTMGEAARDKAVAGFSLETMVERYLVEFETALAGRKRGKREAAR